jgi:23S rRNA pseudouridine1911/1915/1917 synthase
VLISIVYEDTDLLVINKPYGLLTHAVNREDKSETVVDWILKTHPEIAGVHDTIGTAMGQWTELRPGIVHRLDRDTSGLLVIAKTQSAFDYLKIQFQERRIQKTYIALVFGHMKNKIGKIETAIAKINNKQTTQTKGKRELKEKTAVTEYKTLTEYSPSDILKKPTSLLEVSPKTGRTHQIRIHLKSIGHPIVCDPLYSEKRAVCPTELGRLFLHAQKLQLTTLSGQSLNLETDLAPELTNFLEMLPKAEN